MSGQTPPVDGGASRNPAPLPGIWLPCRTLWQREMVRFLRQRGRVIGALGTPVIFWLLMGSGLRDSLQVPDAAENVSYLEFSFPGAIAAILLFTAIFSTISLIDDRREGFLQGVMVAPVSRASIALGKILGATTLAVGQAIFFLVFIPAAGISTGVGSLLATLAAMILLAFGVTGLGFWLAWRSESTQAFHAVMNLVLFPMLVLSGAFFPTAGSAVWLQKIVACNPLTYGVALLRHTLYLDSASPSVSPGVSLPMALGVSLAFAMFTFVLSLLSVSRETTRVLQ